MISRETCLRVLQKAVSTGADYAEIFAENTTNHAISMIASKVDAIKDTVVAGAAVVLCGAYFVAKRSKLFFNSLCTKTCIFNCFIVTGRTRVCEIH